MWRHGDSNPGHPACKAGALPTELYPRLKVDKPASMKRTARRQREVQSQRFGRLAAGPLVDTY